MPDEAFVDANSIRLHYWAWGDDSLPPAVLIHATGFLARLWEPVAEALSSSYHVLAFDSRGHGDSDKPVLSEAEGPALSNAEGPPDGYDWSAFAADLRGFLDALDLKDVVAIGHSAGGAAAAHLAATRPEYISRAVLIEPIIFPTDPDTPSRVRPNELADGASRRRMVWPSRGEMIRAYRRRPVFARWTEDALRIYAEHGTFRREDGEFELKCPGSIESRIFRNSASLGAYDLLPKITCPTLVLHGEHTEPRLAAVAQSAADRIPSAHLDSIDGAGHLVPMERPQALSDRILTFLQKPDPR
jgi:pimeloyl-ACP methyl ester carboxylesterase